VFAELHRKAAQIRSQADELRRQAEQLRKLTQASLGINSALSPDRMLQVVSDFARDILGANQAAAVLALDPTWSSWKSTITFSDPARDWATGRRSGTARRCSRFSRGKRPGPRAPRRPLPFRRPG
jgi:K+-sensing histidine kinase KdpD